MSMKQKKMMVAAEDKGAASSVKKKRIRVKKGQVVGIPLRDGTFALGHVAACKIGIIWCALFARRVERAEELLKDLDEILRDRPIAVMELTEDEIQDGEWPVVTVKEQAYPPELLNTGPTSYS